MAVHTTPNLEPTPTGNEFRSLRFLRSKMSTSNAIAGSPSSITKDFMTPQFVGGSHLHFERLGDLIRRCSWILHQRLGKQAARRGTKKVAEAGEAIGHHRAAKERMDDRPRVRLLEQESLGKGMSAFHLCTNPLNMLN